MAEARPRRGFAGVLLTGAGSAATTAVASGKPWFRADVDRRLVAGLRDTDRSADMPLALALSLVVLAAWGAFLVTRGRVRRAVAALGLVAALGVLACVVAAPFRLPDQARERLPAGSGDVAVSMTAWFVISALGAVVAIAALAVAWRRCPTWPTMSTRYDAPGSDVTEIRTDTDLWKALDEGRDPTDPIDQRGPSSP
jgi:uncharacterized membrane protein (TIGR02234 family)